MSNVKFSKINVRLSGLDGNAFALMGKVSTALRKSGVPGTTIDAFQKEAVSGNYDNLLRVCSIWVNVS